MVSGNTKNQDLEQHITAYLGQRSRPFSQSQLLRSLRIKDAEDRQKVLDILESFIAQNRVVRLCGGKYKSRQQGVEMEGRLDMTGGGFAFVVSKQSEVDIFIPPSGLNSALHGDTVRVFVRETKRRPEGEVIEVLQRARIDFVGVLQRCRENGFVIADSRHMFQDVFVTSENMGGAQDGDKVLVHITRWATSTKKPVGKIIEILGKAGENNAEMHSILAEFGLPYRFEKEVEQAAANVEDDIASELPKRKDFRNVTTLTIDPADAKDFDDALSLRSLSRGRWEVGVHIADVSHYIKPDSIIEQEALRRATSVYLVDRTVPMLPERLSNGLCSLRPNEEKLCFSAIFEMDGNAKVLSSRFERTVIKSTHRFTYEEVQTIIDEGKGLYEQEVLTLHKLAQALRDLRFKNGSVGFERAEARFDIDKSGKPIGVYFREDTTSHQLVEEFMLLANKSVAERIGKPKKSIIWGQKKPKTFVYRIHGSPNEQKLINFGNVAKQLGHTVNFKKEKNISKELNSLLEKVRGTKAQNMLETLALRCMAKATYTTKNIGHYGLAFEYYTHFTSPIRRYPDIMVHRLLERYLAGGSSEDLAACEEKCRHSSEMEQLAAGAERASIKYKMAEYMQDKLGMEFDGIISGVTERGIYVEINENKIEGMVMLRNFKKDYYYFDEENYRVVGRKTHKTYTLGDPVRIRVVKVNMEKKQLDYLMIE